MNITQPLRDRTAIVTGAGQGMGRACAQTLADLGAHLIVNDLDLDKAETTASSLCDAGHKAFAVQADVTDANAVHALVAQTRDHFGDIHILINNAGILYPTKVIDMKESEWDQVIDVNLKGTFLCSQAVLPAMQEAGWGRIVNFSSTAGKNISTVGGAHYTAAKAGILGFTRHLAKEVASSNITVNAVCPGLIDTEMVRSTIDDDLTRAYANSFPINRLGQPEEVADLIAFLCTDKAAYITGASLDINGGDLMVWMALVPGEVQAMERASDFEGVLSVMAEDLKTVGSSLDTCGIDVLDEPVDEPTMAYFWEQGFQNTTHTIDPEGHVTDRSYHVTE